MIILGKIKDIQPRLARPTLELSFDSRQRSFLPRGPREPILLDFNGARWEGTINTVNSNPPYVHGPLRGSDGRRTNCTEVFLELGLAEGASLEFEYQAPGSFSLRRVVDSGRWRAGNEPERRRQTITVVAPSESKAAPNRRLPTLPAPAGTPHGSDVDKLAATLARDFPDIRESTDRAWTRSVAVRVIDCVLSLNRRYDAFVVPRLDRFERNHPEMISIRQLRRLIDTSPSPQEFMQRELEYNDPSRAATLSAVVDSCLMIIGDAPSDDELPRLKKWASSAVPSDYQQLRIPGFGLAGFQYLRMLFGANTTKPDTHIRAYVAEVLGRAVGDLEAVTLLEAACLKLGIAARDADTNIWETRAR